MLKGIDAVLYSQLAELLGLEVKVRLAVDQQRIDNGFDDWEEEEEEMDQQDYDDEMLDEQYDDPDEMDEEELAERVAARSERDARRAEKEQLEAEEKERDSDDDTKRVVYVSSVMRPTANSGVNVAEEGCRELPMESLLPNYKRYGQRVTWLNDAADSSSSEFAVSYEVCGNEPCSAWLYTQVALLVHIPPYEARAAESKAETA